MNDETNEVNMLRIDRLLEFINPIMLLESHHELPKGTLRPLRNGNFGKIEAKKTYSHKHRNNPEWHIGRVKYLLQKLKENKPLPPIRVDNYVTADLHFGAPVILDGFHRLLAYKLAKRDFIPAEYSGRVDILNYLTGKTHVNPLWG